MPLNEYFDDSKKYRALEFQPEQLVASQDFNLCQDINSFDKNETGKYFGGFQLKINHMVNAPVLKVRATYELNESQLLEIEMVDPTHAKWRKNGGAWSAGIAVTCDSLTWNELGTSGLEVVFKSSSVAADLSEVWVSQAVRLLGGGIEFVLAGQFQLNDGKWLILGEFADIATTSVAGCVNDDFLYLKVEHTEIPYTSDDTIAHRLADGEYDANSPSAIQTSYTLMAGAAVPANTSDPFVHNIIIGKVVDSVVGTFIECWSEPFDSQKMWRIFGDTVAPETPTGLAVSTGSDAGYVPSTIQRAVPSIPLFGYLTMSCNQNDEPDVQYYEFKVTRLNAVGGAVTSDSFSQLIYPNFDAGGAGIPIGISHTIHGLSMGVPYRIWVRAVDFSGNVSSWSASTDTVIGGTSSGIAAIALGPTFTLEDTAGMVGFTVSVTALPANAAGYTIWVQEGSYPTVTTSSNSIGSYDANIGRVDIPWKESGHPYVRLKAFDSSGIYQTLYSEDNTSLSASSQLATQTHNDSPSSHGGLIGDLITVTQSYGSLPRAFAKIEAQGFDIKNVYVVSENTGFYQTFDAALDAIIYDAPQRALILVAPGTYDNELSFTWPANLTTAVTIKGFGVNRSVVVGDWDLSNLGWNPIPFTVDDQFLACGLVFQDLSIVGDFTGTNVAGAEPMILGFSNCVYTPISANTGISLDGTTGECSLYIRNTNMIRYGDYRLMELTGNCNLVIEHSQGVIDSATGVRPAILLISPTGSNLILKGNMFQVSNSTTGLCIDASAPVSVHAFHNTFNTAVGVNVTLVTGSVDTNTVMAVDYLYQ